MKTVSLECDIHQLLFTQEQYYIGLRNFRISLSSSMKHSIGIAIRKASNLTSIKLREN